MLIMLLSARHFFTVCRSGMNIAACQIIQKTSNPLPLLFLVWEKQTLCWDSKPEPNSNAQTLFRIGALGWLLFIMVLCSFQTSLCSFVCCIFVARQLVYYIIMGNGSQDSTALKQPMHTVNSEKSTKLTDTLALTSF